MTKTVRMADSAGPMTSIELRATGPDRVMLSLIVPGERTRTIACIGRPDLWRVGRALQEFAQREEHGETD